MLSILKPYTFYGNRCNWCNFVGCKEMDNLLHITHLSSAMILTFYLSYLVSQMACSNISPKKYSDGNEALEDFIEKYMSNTLIIIDKTNDDFIYKMNIPKILYNLDKEMYEFLVPPKDYNYIIIENRETLAATIHRLNLTKNFKNKYKHLIVLNELTEDEISESFLLLWKYYIYNVVIYTNNNFFTWYPYNKENDCAKKVTIVKVTSNPFTKKIPLIAHDCSFNLTWCFITFLMEDPHRKHKPGILFEVLNIISQKMQININYVKSEVNYVDVSERVNNYKHLKAMMLNLNLELAPVLRSRIKCKPREKDGFKESDDLVQFDIYFALPPRKVENRYIYIINLYSPNLFLCIIVAYIVTCFSLKILTTEPFLVVALRILRISLQQGIHQSVGLAVRILLASYLLYDICIYAAWQTELSSLLTTPRLEPKIETFEQLLDSSLSIRGAEYILCSMAGRGDSFETRFRSRMILSKIPYREIVKEFFKDPQYVTMFTSFTLLNFKNVEDVELITRDKINTVHCQLLMRDGFPLLSSMNHWINRIKESGIVDIITKNTVKKTVLMKNNFRVEKTVLGISHLQGAFFILLIGLGASCIIFYLELLVFYR